MGEWVVADYLVGEGAGALHAAVAVGVALNVHRLLLLPHEEEAAELQRLPQHSRRVHVRRLGGRQGREGTREVGQRL